MERIFCGFAAVGGSFPWSGAHGALWLCPWLEGSLRGSGSGDLRGKKVSGTDFPGSRTPRRAGQGSSQGCRDKQAPVPAAPRHRVQPDPRARAVPIPAGLLGFPLCGVCTQGCQFLPQRAEYPCSTRAFPTPLGTASSRSESSSCSLFPVLSTVRSRFLLSPLHTSASFAQKEGAGSSWDPPERTGQIQGSGGRSCLLWDDPGLLLFSSVSFQDSAGATTAAPPGLLSDPLRAPHKFLPRSQEGSLSLRVPESTGGWFMAQRMQDFLLAQPNV